MILYQATGRPGLFLRGSWRILGRKTLCAEAAHGLPLLALSYMTRKATGSEDKFEAAIRALLKAPLTSLADMPRKREPKPPKPRRAKRRT